MKLTKFEIKIIARLNHRLSRDGLDAAIEYGLAVCGGNPQIKNSVLTNAPEPLKTMLDAAFAAKKSRQQIVHVAMAVRRAEVIQARTLANLESARRIGQATVFLAGLTMAERALCKATKNEVDAAIDMRRNCVRSTKLKEILQCTDTELKRWSEDGRLPVMFRRRMLSSVGITLDVRHWDASLVHEALQHINQWREDDLLARRRKQGTE